MRRGEVGEAELRLLQRRQGPHAKAGAAAVVPTKLYTHKAREAPGRDPFLQRTTRR